MVKNIVASVIIYQHDTKGFNTCIINIFRQVIIIIRLLPKFNKNQHKNKFTKFKSLQSAFKLIFTFY